LNYNGKIQGFLFDLDGVFCIGDLVLPGAIKTLTYLNSNNIPYRFLTNTTTKSRLDLFNKLIDLGFPVEQYHIISAAYAGVLKLRELQCSSCELVLNDSAQQDYSEFNINNNNPEYIVIGDLDKDWTFDVVDNIFNKVINGSKIVALHKGKYFKVSNKLQIDSGAFIAGIEYASSTESIVVGKPTTAFFDIAVKDINIEKKNLVMVGDDIINDIQGAQLSGINGILVQTGKYRKDLIEKANIQPQLMISSIDKVLDLINQ
tara:strand:+ start:496 stop:1275 length:780 start_codon:yes stop_codon:yes gene_type:complete